jgi:hypothetical protein
MRKSVLLSVLFSLVALIAQASKNSVEMADTFRADGKIRVVIAVILIILIGLFVFLFNLDKKVNKLHKDAKENIN